MSDYPHTIDNGAGERLTFLGVRSDEQGEFLEIPAPVKRVVFPIVVAVGRLLGLHRRFADAPEPVRPSASTGSRAT